MADDPMQTAVTSDEDSQSPAPSCPCLHYLLSLCFGEKPDGERFDALIGICFEALAGTNSDVITEESFTERFKIMMKAAKENSGLGQEAWDKNVPELLRNGAPDVLARRWAEMARRPDFLRAPHDKETAEVSRERFEVWFRLDGGVETTIKERFSDDGRSGATVQCTIL